MNYNVNERDPARRRRRQNCWIIILSVLLLLILLFVISVVYFNKHYPFKTTLYGIDLSLQKKCDVIERPMDEVYRLTGDFPGAPLKFNLQDFGGEYHIAIDEQPAALSWIINSLDGVELTGEMTEQLDDQALETWLREKIPQMEGGQMPRDAEIVREGKEYIVEPEVSGTIFGERTDEFIDAVFAMIHEAEPELDVSLYYQQPAVRVTDLADEVEKLNQIKIEIPELKEVISNDEILAMLDDDGNPIRKKAEGKIWALASEYDTYERRRPFTTVHGKRISLEPGVYGWRTDVPTSTDRLIALLDTHEGGALEMAYQEVARQRGEDDIGPSYIEISLDEQKLWYIVDGKVSLTFPVITGLPTPERETTRGVGMVWSREYEKTLVGTDYRLDVEFWMPFNWNHQGMHSAYWFTEGDYQPTTYLTRGSHGCVNMQRSDVYQLFQTVDVGTPVIIY